LPLLIMESLAEKHLEMLDELTEKEASTRIRDVPRHSTLADSGINDFLCAHTTV